MSGRLHPSSGLTLSVTLAEPLHLSASPVVPVLGGFMLVSDLSSPQLTDEETEAPTALPALLKPGSCAAWDEPRISSS